jgi:hypothetical protein
LVSKPPHPMGVSNGWLNSGADPDSARCFSLVSIQNPFDCNDIDRDMSRNIGNRKINVVGVHWTVRHPSWDQQGVIVEKIS